MPPKREYSRADLIQTAQMFAQRFGKFPAQADFKGERKAYYEDVLKSKLPHARCFEREFGSWGALRTLLGEEPSKFTPDGLSEKVSMEFAQNVLGMVPVDNETGVVDGYIGDLRVEVKGSLLTRASVKDSHYRFRWMLHHRELSKLVDKVVCVGVLKNGEIGVVLQFDGEAVIADRLDGRKTLDFSVNTLYGSRESVYWPYITHRNVHINADNIEDYVL